MPLEEKVQRADLVIDNRGTPEETERQVREAWNDISEYRPKTDD
jgi:dephospho-CoA kinase